VTKQNAHRHAGKIDTRLIWASFEKIVTIVTKIILSGEKIRYLSWMQIWKFISDPFISTFVIVKVT